MFHFSNIVRTKGDPRIIEGGPSLKQPVDHLARALGWFSIGLGVVELFAPRRVTETLGMEGHETMVRAFGVREIMAGIMTLSVEKNAGLWTRVGGDGLDAAALLSGLAPDNPKKGNIALALLMVGGIAMLTTGPRKPPSPAAPRAMHGASSIRTAAVSPGASRASEPRRGRSQRMRDRTR